MAKELSFILFNLNLVNDEVDRSKRFNPFSVPTQIRCFESSKIDNNQLFITHETPPKYSLGSNEELMALIYEELTPIRKTCLKGISIISVMINNAGKVESPEVIRSLAPETEAEFIELIQQYEFEPATFLGKTIECRMIFPIKLEWL